MLVIAVGVVGAAVLTGVLVWRWATPPALPQGASPAMVARTYFELDSAGRTWAAMHYVLRTGGLDEPNGRSYGGSHLVRVSKVYPQSKQDYASRYDSLAQLCGVTISYHRTRTDEVGNPPGDYDTFVLLGRATRAGPWRVVYIGDPL